MSRLKNLGRPIVPRPDHLEEQAAARVRKAEQLPPGEAKQHALKNAAQLRSYADMKRLLMPPARYALDQSKGIISCLPLHASGG
jgi:hypothetical protein